jgi:hypothetical protein
VCSDVVLMFQYIYYGALQRSKERILKLKSRHRHHHHHQHQQQQQQQQQQAQQDAAGEPEQQLPTHLLQPGFTATSPAGRAGGISVSTPVAMVLSLTALLCCSTGVVFWQVSGPASGTSDSSSGSGSSSQGARGLVNVSRHMATATGPHLGVLLGSGSHWSLGPDSDWVL